MKGAPDGLSGNWAMKKKLTAWVLAIMIICCTTVAFPEAASPAEKTQHKIEPITLTVYISTLEANLDMVFYLMDGVTDLLWVDLDSACGLVSGLGQVWRNDKGFELSYAVEGKTVTLTRENSFHMTFDFEENKISCLDYNLFLHDSTDTSALDLLYMKGYNAAGEAELFQRNQNATFDRLGSDVEFCLSDYAIEMVFQDGCGYIPLQTLGDLILTPAFGLNTFYNGKAVFIANASLFGNETEGYTPLGEYYYSAEPCERSETLAEFGYNELCLALDCLYGLWEIHEIDSFSNLFWQLGSVTPLKDRNASEADKALSFFINCYLDDLHSGFNGRSWMNAEKTVPAYFGTMYNKYLFHLQEYSSIRNRILGEVPVYTEVGNTAYITFDSFDVTQEGGVYYESLKNGTLPDDTIGQIIKAHAAICREGSPIENVVIDLSNNGGGHVDAGLFLLGWVLGDAPFCVKDTFTGALSTATYRADTNLDRVFDERDVLTDKRIFCLISPVSFSCGNLVPAVFKYSQRVTLLGRTSGGGSCTILPMSTAWGTMFQISSQRRMSFFKNGSFYDIDQGVDPDIYLTKIENFYDREKLTEYINNLF